MLNSPSVIVTSGAENGKVQGNVRLKTEVGTLTSNIVSILPSVVVDSDAMKRKIQKTRPIKNKRKQNDLSNIDGKKTKKQRETYHPW